MPFPILAGKAIVDTGFNVANSCRFAFGDSPKLSIGNDKGSNVTKFTFSCWFKTTTQNSSYGRIYYTSSAGGEVNFTMYAAGYLAMIFNDGSAGERSWLTTAKYRDPTAWYHAVVRYDSTDATAADRQQLWINGVRVTSFSESANVAENEAMPVFNDENFAVGREVDANDRFSFDGYLAEVCLIDGTAYTATDFGEYDEDSPATWKPKDVSGLTFGAKGFYLDFEDSSALGNDVSGNNNDLTVSNLAAVDQCTDSPTNNFCTMNPLRFAGTLTQGNCLYVPTATAHTAEATFGITAGLWYWEMRVSDDNQVMGLLENGISIVGNSDDNYPSYTILNNGSTTWTAYNNVSAGNQGSTFSGTAVTDSGNDIVMMAFDADNENLYVGLNGTWQNSGDPTSGATGTGAVITSVQARYGGTLVPFVGVSAGASRTFDVNFGNPTWSLSSAVNDGNGYGNFEYAPPSGFLALCTKNLGSDGG